MTPCPRCATEITIVATEGGRPVALEPNPLGNIILERVDGTDQARWLHRDQQPADPLQPRYRAHAVYCTGPAS